MSEATTMGTPQNLAHAANWKPWEVDYHPEYQWHYWTDTGARHEGFATIGKAIKHAGDLLTSSGRAPDHVTFKSPPSYTPPGTPPQGSAPTGKTPQNAPTPAQNPPSGAAVEGVNPFGQLREERGVTYGPIRANHDNIGMVWTGLLQAYFKMEFPGVIPGFMVAQMMAALKGVRASHANVADSYIDGQHYVQIAHELDDRERVG